MVKIIHVLRVQATKQVWDIYAYLITFLVCLFPLLLVIWRQTLHVPFFALSADDFARTLSAWDVTRGRIIPSDLWPPLQFWVEALVLQLYPHLLSVPYIVNVFASTGTVACLVLLGYLLGLSRATLLLQCILIVSIPWFIWLSLSGLAEPLFFMCIALTYVGIAAWQAHHHYWGIWVAALSLLAAGMVRFDGWGYSVVFSLALFWYWWRSTRPRPHVWLLAATIPWIFPVLWLAYNAVKYQNPLYFSEVIRNYILATQGAQTLSTRLLEQPRDLWTVAGITVPFGVVGLWLLYRRPGVTLLSIMWLASFVFLVLNSITYTTASHDTARLVVIHALLLTPSAACTLLWIAGRHRVVAIVVGATVAILVMFRLIQVPLYPRGMPDDVMKVGQHIGELRTLGQIQSHDRILIEVLFWDYVELHVLTNDPGAVIFDRSPTLVIAPDGKRTLDDTTNPSILALAPAQLHDELKCRDVHLVVAYSDRAVRNLRSIAKETLHAGRFRVFVLS